MALVDPGGTPAPTDLGMSPPDDRIGGEGQALASLRQILVGRENARLDLVESRLASMEHQIGDDEALVAVITPLMHTAIRRQIQEARAEMIEALYPIIGALIGRAVSEAMRDLARQVDARMRQGADPRLWWWRLRARLGGASGDETALRAFLPFRAGEVFLIHRETGLLLGHASRPPESHADSELIGGMLTAIRDFASDAFGQGQAGELDEVQVGQHRILIESGQLSFLAVAAEGVEPPGFRTELREQLRLIERDNRNALRGFDGDATALDSIQPALAEVLGVGQPRPLSRTQKWLLAGTAAGVLLAIAALIAAGVLVWRFLNPPPTPAPAAAPAITIVVTATPAPVEPSPIPTVQRAVMRGNAWAHDGPAAETPRMRVVRLGEVVEVLDASGAWLLVHWTSGIGGKLTGWVPADQVELEAPAPAAGTPSAP